MKLRTKRTAWAAGVGAGALVFGLLAPSAYADPAAQGKDVVGVGSDTVEFIGDFLMDGDTSSHLGFNSGKLNRAYNEFATGDSNGRALYDAHGNLLYTQGTTSITLRGGTKPVKRPDGSGDGVQALIDDSVGSTAAGYNHLPQGSVNYARMSRWPKSTEFSQCSTNATGCAGLHIFMVAVDHLGVAVDSDATNAPAAGLTATQLAYIYSHCASDDATKGVYWDDPTLAITGATHAHIVPVIPQGGSGTRSFFLHDIGVPDATVTGLGCIKVSEEHDPTGVTLSGDTLNAIEPFSTGRAALATSGYFANSGEAATDFHIAVQVPGSNGVSSGAFYDDRGLFVAVRQYDVDNTGGHLTAFEPGSTKTWVEQLFYGAGNWAAKGSSALLVQAAGPITSASPGLTPKYCDLGTPTATSSAPTDPMTAC